MRKKQLLERKAALVKENGEHLARVNAGGEGIDLTVELAAIKTREAEITGLDDQLKSIEELETLTRNNAARAAGQATAATVHDNAQDAPWKSFGEQLQAIVFAAAPGHAFGGRGGRVDPRLHQNLAPTGGAAGVPSDGGFLIHTDFSSEIYKRTYNNGALASRCNRVTIGADSDGLEVPYVDETSRATGSRFGGIRVYRAQEADSVTASRPKLGKWECRLEDLKGLAYATERLLRDASAMTSIYTEAFSSEFAFVLDEEIMAGTGAGQCMGILNAACTVQVAAEGAQTATTLNMKNIVKMWARCYGASRSNAVWFYNQDVEPQFPLLTSAATSSSQVVFLPPGGLSGSQYSTLFGRPMIPLENCRTLGTVGDIVLADMSQYTLIEKDGMDAQQSMHVRFIYDEMTFKFRMRVNGAPKWKTALTPAQGSNTLSPFITLAAR